MVCVFVCVCVCKRRREGEREKDEMDRSFVCFIHPVQVSESPVIFFPTWEKARGAASPSNKLSHPNRRRTAKKVINVS